jgi:hypothetical protein
MCIEIPKLPEITLGLGLSLDPPSLTTPSIGVDFCCRFNLLPPITIHLPLPPLSLNVGVVASLSAVTQAIQAYLDSVAPDCPRE